MKRTTAFIDRSETFDGFLASKNMLADTEEWALKEIIADQIGVAMKEGRLTKTAMAARIIPAAVSLIGCSIRTIHR